MKNSRQILFFFLLILHISLKAQHTYIPIPESNVEWVYGMIDGNCAPPLNLCGYFHCKIEGDTIIGNYTYKKIMTTGLNSTTYYFTAAIRQVVVEKKVYVIYGNGCLSVDTLLYNFNLEQGDTLKQCEDLIGGITNPTVETVDSVLIDGLWRKSINLNFGTSLIEGLGSTRGFLGPWNGWIGGYYFLACFSINGVSLYPNTLCTLVGINSKHDSKTEIQIFPNPIASRATIYINMPHPALGKVNIYNLTSSFNQNIFSGKLDSGINSIELNASELSAGLYVLKVSYGGNELNKLIVIFR